MVRNSAIRVVRSPAYWVIVIAICIAFLANIHGPHGFGTSSQSMAEDRPSLAKMATESNLLREGAVLTEVKGRFRKEGERYWFYISSEEGSEKRYRCLENYSLQRVVSAIQGEDRKLIWLVSAKITEFNDENFLLIEKAIRTR